MDEEDIQKELQEQGVTKVERMKRRKDGRLIPADSYILTINGQEIPKEIKVGFLIRPTKVYIPNPQWCFNCQKYGHNKRFCKNEQKCAKCGQPGHEDHECKNETKCVNCDGDHPAYNTICPKWKTEKEILKIKFQNNIPFHEARQQVEGPSTDPSKSSYANVTKPHQWTKSITSPNNFKSEEDWLTHTIDSLLKRLDNIKNQKSMQNNAPYTSSASQLPVSTQIIPEQINQPTVSNSRSASPLTAQHEASAASDDDNEMESINARSNEVITIALTRNLIVLSAKSLPLVPQPVGGMALPCRQGQEGEIHQRSLLSALTLQDQEDRGLLGENGLSYGLLTNKNIRIK